MKTRQLFILTIFYLFVFVALNVPAQEATKTNLPEGAKLRIGKGTLGEIAYFPDGTRFAVATSIGIWVYDSITGKELHQLSDHTNGVDIIRFSPDGNTIATESPDGSLYLWNTNTGSHIRTLSDVDFGLYDPVFSPNGKIIAVQYAEKFTYFQKTLRLYDVKTGKHINTTSKPINRFYNVRFSPDSKKLATWGYNRQIKLWNTSTGQLLKTIIDPGDIFQDNRIIDFQFSPDGNTIVVLSRVRYSRSLKGSSWVGNVGIVYFRDVDIEEWKQLEKTRHSLDDEGFSSISFSHDGAILVTIHKSDGNVDLWDANTGDYINSLIGNDISKISTVSFSDNGRIIATGGQDGTIHLWAAKQGMYLIPLSGHKSQINNIIISPDGMTILSKSTDNTVHLWNAITGQLLNTFDGFTEDVATVSFSPDGNTIASGSSDKKVRLWNVATGQLLNTLTGHTSYIHSVCYSADGKTIASGGADTTVRLWDAITGEHIRTLTGHKRSVKSVFFTADGQIVGSSDSDSILRLWDAKTGDHLKTLNGEMISPDGKLIIQIEHGQVEGDDSFLYLSDVDTGKLRKQVTYSGSFGFECFSPDGKLFVMTDSNNSIIELWDVGTVQIVKTYSGHVSLPFGGGGTITTVRFSKDVSTIASGSLDKTVRLWSINKGEPLKTLSGHTDGISSLAFSPDGKTLASGSSDGTILLWDTTNSEMGN